VKKIIRSISVWKSAASLTILFTVSWVMVACGAGVTSQASNGAVSWDVAQSRIGTSVPILTYHDITYIPHNPWAMSPSQFADEMQFLRDKGFHPMTLDQLYAAMHGL
jgi:hypothetical protein